ncbi:class I SAM-dependent methyltransferase [Salininema proteolyticum]|uniref:Class I SAM-dependent methyltransferase n=1 Tax=Salininema proteolyticum TaxID=1607685 RepID=A0ABV8U5A7_9ACTN
MTHPDFVRATNIADNVDLYERENEAVDPEGLLWRAIRDEADWSGRTLLDLGCGTGFWLPRYSDAARAVGVEPDPDLLRLAERRGVEAVAGSAENLPFPDDSFDVVHARFAYFWPPHCEAGRREVLRVLKPGGRLVVIDNDHRRGQFAELLAASPWAEAQGRGEVTDEWWASRGAARREILSSWEAATPEELESILRIEFPADVVDDWVAGNPGASRISYGYVLFTTEK